MITFNEYKNKFYEKKPCVIPGTFSDDEMMIEYYMDMFGENGEGKYEDLIKERNSIERLAYKIVRDDINRVRLEMRYADFYFLLKLLVRIEGSSKDVISLEMAFTEYNLNRLSEIEKSSDFDLLWKENLENIELRVDRISCTGIPIDEIELCYQYELFYNHLEEIIQIGNKNPYSIVRWFQSFKIMYHNKPKLLDRNYDAMYFSLLQMSVLRSKELNRFDLLSDFIVEREELITSKYTKDKYRRKFRELILGKILGYGEKLDNIIISILLFGFVMVITYMIIDLKGMPDCGLERFIAAAYFFLTTCFTIGYGDISPDTTVARIVVMINQVVGFFLSGSLIALYLRKWFRD